MTPQGPQFMLFDKTGRPIQGYPAVPEYKSLEQTGPMGEKYNTFYPSSSPPGVNAPIMTQPPPQMTTQGMPESTKEKVLKLEQFRDQLNNLKNMGQNENVFGLWANTQAKLADTPVGAITPADPSVLAFHKNMKRIENVQVHEFGGSNLTSQELQRALASLPRAYNQQDFNVAVDNLIRGTQEDINNYYKFYGQNEIQRGMKQGKPSLNLNQPKMPSPAEAEQMLIQKGYKKDASGRWIK